MMTQFPADTAVQWHSETQLAQDTGTTIDTWFAHHAQTGMLKMADGIKCAYAILIADTCDADILSAEINGPTTTAKSRAPELNQNRKTLVISSGRGESYVKYKEVLFDLHHAGFDIFIMDHRGQGLSQRSVTNPMQGYVADFQQYVDDLFYFIDEHVIAHCAQPLLLCHSMGSTIGALAILQRPEQFTKVVFCAPMFGLRVPVPMWLAQIIMHIGLLTSQILRRPLYFIGHGDYAPVDFAQNQLMQSPVRYSRFRKCQEQYPQTQLGGVTYQWVAAANDALKRLDACASQISIPVLCLNAQHDTVVNNERQRAMIEQIPNAKWEVIPAARHEILFEKDVIRQPALTCIVDFLRT